MTMLSYITAALVIICLPSHALSLLTYYEAESNKNKNCNVTAMALKATTSRIQCALQCQTQEDCTGVEFHQKTGTKLCLLLQKSATPRHSDNEIHSMQQPNHEVFMKKMYMPQCGQCTTRSSDIGTICDCTALPVGQDCSSFRNSIRERGGIFHIRPMSLLPPITVYCDMNDGEPWIVIQRRTTGNLNFWRTWQEYKIGFGSSTSEFWLGNEIIHLLTESGTYQIKFEIERKHGENVRKEFAMYQNFSIRSESQRYSLHHGGYLSGHAGDSLSGHTNFAFQTKDNDTSGHKCATVSTGAWWYNACHSSNLNGQYYPNGSCPYGKGMSWISMFGTHTTCATSTVIKIRPSL